MFMAVLIRIAQTGKNLTWSIKIEMDKQISSNKEWTADTCNNKGKCQNHYAKWKQMSVIPVTWSFVTGKTNHGVGIRIVVTAERVFIEREYQRTFWGNENVLSV